MAEQDLVLVLGGTGEARALAAALASRLDLRFVSSLAGRVRDPALPVGDVRIGGFGGIAGLSEYLRSQPVAAVVDATHPFAATISAHADAACLEVGVPRVVLRRPTWSAELSAGWHRVATITEAPAQIAELAPASSCVFLTTGRRDISVFAADGLHRYLVRTVDPPDSKAMPPNSRLLLARGPYTVEGERALMVEHDVRVLVTKDSGGELTSAKLHAARELGVPVVVVSRPPVPPGSTCVPDVAEVLRWLDRTLGVGYPATPADVG
jgi:precorrin-6A/cobalt-precorrin-6A reductase